MMKYTEPSTAFETAIYMGVLSAAPSHPLFAGHYMYMGDNDRGEHLFKHKSTRHYLPPVPQR